MWQDGVDEKSAEVRNGADGRVTLRAPICLELIPAKTDHAHVDLVAQVLKLLSLGLAGQFCVNGLHICRALRHPRLKELVAKSVVVHGSIERGDKAFLAPCQLCHVMLGKRLAPFTSCVLRLLAHRRDKRRAKLISHEGAGPEEAAIRRRVWRFGLALAPV